MKRKKYVYFLYNDTEDFFVTSGITFFDYARYRTQSLEHLLLIKTNGFGNDVRFGFELLEGLDAVSDFVHKKEFEIGNLCFVDYNAIENVSMLTNQEIAELLFLSHMRYPLNTPFFQSIDNRIVYLSHDDGWYCKLFVQNKTEPIIVLLKKIFNIANMKISDELENKLQTKVFTLSKEGIMFDLDDVVKAKKTKKLPVYSIGIYEDMDEIGNHIEKRKKEAKRIYEINLV